eukprot:2813045-Alexandrium_andersonii.AAC.1
MQLHRVERVRKCPGCPTVSVMWHCAFGQVAPGSRATPTRRLPRVARNALWARRAGPPWGRGAHGS